MIAPVATGLTRNLATGNSRVGRRTAVRARILAAGRIAAPTAAMQSRGRSAMLRHPIMSAAIPDLATARGNLTSPATTSPVTTSHGMIGVAKSVHVFRVRARTVPAATAHFANGPNSIARARIARNSTVRAKDPRAVRVGRSIRAATAMPIGRGATTRMTARSSPSVRRSAAVAPIVNGFPTNAVRRGRRAKRNPASASPRWCRGRGWPRAATPRNGSCRAASPSTAASSTRRRSMSPPTMSSPSTASHCRRASAPGCSFITSRAA